MNQYLVEVTFVIDSISVKADNGRLHDLDDVIAEFGFTDQEIDEAED